MAKLNGVKTLDMKNGEITKVAYNGEEYAKVDKYEGLQKGDIFLAGPHTKFLGNMDTQGYYELIGVQSDGDPIFEDDRGNVRKPGMGAVGVLYRKISASTSPTIEKRVDELESRVSALEGEKPGVELTKGDLVKIIGLSKYGSDHIGRNGVVVYEANIDGWIYVNVDGIGRYYKAEQLELIATSNEIIEFEGEKYRKVDREAREGDVVIFTKEQASATTDLTAGKPYLVVNHFNDDSYLSFTADDGSPYGVYYNHFKRTPETVDVYEPISESKPKYEPKVGDIVKIVSNTTFSENKIGDIGKVAKVGSDRFTVEVPNGPKTDIWTGLHDVRPATAEEIAQYEKAVAKSKLKAGDFVVFTDVKAFDDYFTAEKPYEVKAGYFDDLYIFNDVEMADYGALDKYEYKILSEEEVKWAKLGRKVGEYKKGDVVRIIKATVSKNDGEYGTVEDVREDAIGVRLGDGDYRGVYFDEGNIAQLIAPVESVLTHN